MPFSSKGIVAAMLALTAQLAAAQGTRWTLRETLRIGGDENGPAAFVSIRAFDVDARGRILVFERSTQDIRMFAPDGKFVKTIGRSGSGPGEMKNAEGMIINRDGRIWLRDAANTRFTVFSAEGEYEASWTMRFCWSQGIWRPQVDRQGRLIDYDCVVGGDVRPYPYAILAYRGDRSGVDTLHLRPECGSRELSEAGTWVRRSEKATMYTSIPFAPFPVQAIGPSGESWCAPNSSRYELMRVMPGAKDTVRVSRNVPAIPVTRAERDSIIGRFDEKGPSGLDFSRIPSTKPVVGVITIDSQGRAWIRRADARGNVTFDVFNAAGQFVASVDLGAGVRMGPAAQLIVRDQAVYTVVLDEDDVQYVVRLQIATR